MSKQQPAPISKLQNIRFAHVTSVPFFLVTQLKRQMEFLRENHVDIVMVTSNGAELGQLQLKPGFEHAKLDIRRRPAPIQDLLALVRLTRLCHQRGFDILHSTTPKAGLLTAIAGFIARVPVRLHTFTGQQWITMRGPLRWISRWSDWLIGKLNTRVYADSPSQRQYLIHEGIVRPECIGVIGSGSLAGVDVMRFDKNRMPEEECTLVRKGLGIEPGSTVIVFIGRITHEKGIRELLDACQALVDEGLRINLLLIGPVDAELEGSRQPAASSSAVSFGAMPWVHTLGYTDKPERYLAISDIMALPSYREGFGTVVIEAAAMGVPTVGTKINGLRDAIVDGETGLLVPPRDADALATALRRLIADPELRNQLGAAARKRCKDQFDADVVNRLLAVEYVRLLQEVKHGAVT